MKFYMLTVGKAMRDHLNSLAGGHHTQWVMALLTLDVMSP